MAFKFQLTKIKIFHKNKQNIDKFFENIFIDSGKISDLFGQQPPVMTKREELKINEAREEWEKLFSSKMEANKSNLVNLKIDWQSI